MKPQGIEPHRQQDLFDGQGDVLIYNLIGNKNLPPFEAVLACELEPKGFVGAHVQQSAHEIVIITEGEGIAQVNGLPQELVPGSVVYLPFGKELMLRNSSIDKTLRYLIIKVSAQ